MTSSPPQSARLLKEFERVLGEAGVEGFHQFFLEHADALDDGDLSGYTKDERNSLLFDGLIYDRESNSWLARFHIIDRGNDTLPPFIDLGYIEVEIGVRALHGCGIKPSQSWRALAAFDRQFKMALKDLTV